MRVAKIWIQKLPSILQPLIFQINSRSIGTTFNPSNFANWGSTKNNRKIKIHLPVNMTNPETEKILAPFRASVKQQGDLVRQLKSENVPELDLKKAIAELKHRKKLLEDKEMTLISTTTTFDRARMEDLLKRRFFYDQSFAIYGGVAGQYDFGPMGCATKTNLLTAWRNFFVLEEQMLEVDCSILTPEPVLKASGHVDRFADLMVKDLKTGDCYRLDHLIKSHLEKIKFDKKVSDETRAECEDVIVKLDGMTKEEMSQVMKKYIIKSPTNNNDLSEPMEFNLMFETNIGPTGSMKGYLRPETAQGIFVNFKRLLAFNQDRLPFAAAQIGNAFRNEISPRSGLIRVREFTMAEIEYFVNPAEKDHSKFHRVKDIKVLLYSACNQMDGQSPKLTTVGEAVSSKLIANESLGYFIGRIQIFLTKIGIDSDKLRFRQHMSNEMAHYACDCWDAECLTSYGWIECVGCADRSAYDLTQHYKATGVKLVAEKKLDTPKVVECCEIIPQKKLIGKTFKERSQMIIDALTRMDEEKLQSIDKGDEYELNVVDQRFMIPKEMVKIEKYEKNVHVEEIIPAVIEPSFGIGRIMYAIFEQNFRAREGDEKRTYLTLPPIIAPVKCSLLPLSGNDEFLPFVERLVGELGGLGVSCKIDASSGSIGRRYARTDEIAIPFGITIDFDTLKVPHSVTLRDRDTMTQVRINLDEISSVVKDLAEGRITWDKIQLKYPKFEQQESSEEKKKNS